MKLTRIASTLIAGLCLSLLPLAGNAGADVLAKHPRVAELEDRLAQDASAYLKGRFPDVPFFVVARVDPLRRSEGYAGGSARGEALPYFELEDEEVRDEWDDPKQSLPALLMRVRKVSLSLSLPDRLNETEVAELKDSLFAVLHLTPARDEIGVERKSWRTSEPPRFLIYGSAAVLLCLLGGLLFIGRSSANRIANALADVKSQLGSNQGSAAASPASMAPDVSDRSSAAAGGEGGSKDVKFNDPIRLKELAARLVAPLAADPRFPSYLDLIELDRMGRKSPARLGALLAELPVEAQHRLFSLSWHECWLDALNEPGTLDFEAIEVVQRILQNSREEAAASWDELIALVWRLGERRVAFLKQMPSDEALAILAAMPRSVALASARRALPGAWGAVLDPSFKPIAPAAPRIAELRALALQIKPLNDISVVRKYRSDKDLLEYLRTADLTEEREIYEASPEDSVIHLLRPPFYRVLEQSPEVLKNLVPSIPLDQWALALFNAPKPERAKVESHLSEKQRFLLVERLRRLDGGQTERTLTGLARERIAAHLQRINAAAETAGRTDTSAEEKADAQVRKHAA